MNKFEQRFFSNAGEYEGSIGFYVSETARGQGDNHGREMSFPERLEGDLKNCRDWETEIDISPEQLLKKFSGWYCNVFTSWDADGSNL